MKKIFTLFILLLAVSSVKAQYEFMPLSYDYTKLYESSLYGKSVDLHTSVRPLRKSEVDSVVNVDSTLLALQYKGKFFQSWMGRALFSHHFIEVRTKDFDLSIDPLLDFRIGKEKGSSNKYQYTNTRGFYIQGRIGKQITFMTSFAETQARFQDYVNEFIDSSQVAPGQGFARDFKDNGYDFANAFGSISYTPSKYFNIALGQGRVFIGEGHRSLFLGDGTFNYPYAKIETTVWKIKYVNVWTQMRDINKDLEVNQQYRKKWMSAHYLSYNVNSRLNLSLFESVTYGSDTNNRGIEISFFNPIIFFRPIEFANGSDNANVVIGFGASYKLAEGLLAYTQFALDEFVKAELFSEPGSWRNKYSVQLGLKYANAFGVKNLFLRGELNAVRPYMYQHVRTLTNYGHYNQSFAHTWGANLYEAIFQAHYQYKRLVADLQINLGSTGLDTNSSNWGGNIYISYNDRESDSGNKIGQGIGVKRVYVEARLAYLVNPSYNMRIEGGAVYRAQTYDVPKNGTDYKRPYLYVGLRTSLFNNYYDF